MLRRSKLLSLALALMMLLGMACPAVAEEAGNAGIAAEAEATQAPNAEETAEAAPETEEAPETEAPAEEAPETEAAEAAAGNPKIPADYEKVAEDERFNLYLKKETLAIIVESKASGAVLYSTVQNPDDFKDNATWKGFYQSGVVMEYIQDVQTRNAQADFINSASEITYQFRDNGFTAHVDFTDIEIEFDVILEMTKAGFDVTIPQESIVEGNSDVYTTAAFYLFPFLGYSYLGEDDGYMIIPDGQGALINLEDNESRYNSPFDKQVYGTNIGIDDLVLSETSVQAEDIIMPVFGMVHTTDQIGFLGVIEEGDVSAHIQAYPNGVRMKFDWICAKYNYRQVYSQPMGRSAGVMSARMPRARTFDIVQHFLLADGADATYAGLAVAYRDYLIEKGAFERAENRVFDVGIDFLGMERENYILGKTDVVMTSFEQAGDIVTELRSKGVERMSLTYRGWQTDGLTGGVPTGSFSPAKSLGGKKGLEEFRSRAAMMGSVLALEADVLSLNTETHPTLIYSALKKITSETWSRPTFGMVYDRLYYLTPAVAAEQGTAIVRALDANNIKGIALTGTTQLVADYYYRNEFHDAGEMAEAFASIADTASSTMSATLSRPNAYLWRYADAVTDMPIGGSDYTFTDAEIPFLAIAMSGQIPYYAEYTNFQANTKEFFLHLMEQGVRPSFLLTWEDPIELQNTNSADIYSSRYELYADMISEWYVQLEELHRTVGGSGRIVNHERSGDMVRVTWDNGTKVYLNFGDKTGTMGGYVLESMSYKVVSGNGN